MGLGVWERCLDRSGKLLSGAEWECDWHLERKLRNSEEILVCICIPRRHSNATKMLRQALALELLWSLNDRPVAVRVGAVPELVCLRTRVCACETEWLAEFSQMTICKLLCFKSLVLPCLVCLCLKGQMLKMINLIIAYFLSLHLKWFSKFYVPCLVFSFCFFPEIILNRLYFFFFCLFPFFVASPEISLGSFKYFELNCQCLLTCLM